MLLTIFSNNLPPKLFYLRSPLLSLTYLNSSTSQAAEIRIATPFVFRGNLSSKN